MHNINQGDLVVIITSERYLCHGFVYLQLFLLVKPRVAVYQGFLIVPVRNISQKSQ